MLIEPLVFLLLVFGIVALTLIVIGLALSYENALKKLSRSEEEKHMIQAHLAERARRLMEDAEQKALQIIQEADKTAAGILNEAKSFQGGSKELLHQQLEELTKRQYAAMQKITQDLLITYQSSIQRMQEEDINIYKGISKNIEKAAVSEIDAFKKVLKDGTLSSEKRVEEKVQQEYQAIEKELKDYKEQKMKELEDSLYEIVQKATEQVIGKSLTINDHEQLVLNALAETHLKSTKSSTGTTSTPGAMN